MFKLFSLLLLGVVTSIISFKEANACGGGGGGGCGSSGRSGSYGGARTTAATKALSGGPSVAKSRHARGQGDPKVARQNAVIAPATARSETVKTTNVASTKAKQAAEDTTSEHEGMNMGDGDGGMDDMGGMMCPGCMGMGGMSGMGGGEQAPAASRKASGGAMRGMAGRGCGC